MATTISLSTPFFISHLTPNHRHLNGQKLTLTSLSLSPRCIRSRPNRISAARAPVDVSSRPHIASLYDVLGVHYGATCQEIKKAYRRLARVSHPDVVSSDDGQSACAGDEFMRIHAAYSTLCDPEKRAEYDRARFVVGVPRGVTKADLGFLRFNIRTWETDQCW